MIDPDCPKCQGVGWLQIGEPSVDKLVPPLPDGALAGLTPEEAAQVERAVEAMRAAARNTWYPCRVCNSQAFYRWLGKHWEADHNQLECQECVAVMGKRAARRAVAAQPDHRARAAEPERQF